MEKSSTTSRSKDVYVAGIKYFDEAIRVGTYEYQNADWDDNRGEFVKQVCPVVMYINGRNPGLFESLTLHLSWPIDILTEACTTS